MMVSEIQLWIYLIIFLVGLYIPVRNGKWYFIGAMLFAVVAGLSAVDSAEKSKTEEVIIVFIGAMVLYSTMAVIRTIESLKSDKQDKP